MHRRNPALHKQMVKVHEDDIHGIVVVDEDRIVSGSKDATVKLFNHARNTYKTVSSSPSASGSYRHWVTAIGMFPDKSVVVGSRNNYLLCKNVEDSQVFYSRIFSAKAPVTQSQKACYKQRNEQRITGIKCLNLQPPYSYTALVGMPQQFFHVDFDQKAILGSFCFREPEWVYGFCQINATQVAVIHAGDLSLFQFHTDEELNQSKWQRIDKLITEPQAAKFSGKQRPFISSVLPVESEMPSQKIALAFFGGATGIVDIETRKFVHKGKEHKGRVWQTVPMSPNEYISCADDGLIKIWDSRCQASSLFTYGNHPGRVSSVAVIREKYFVSGTCASDPRSDPNRAQFYFYDVRKSQNTDENLADSMSGLGIGV